MIVSRNSRFIIFSIIFFCSCSVSKNYRPDKKYPASRLKEDYALLRIILEKKHPSLYWYTSKDSMDYYFDKGYNGIQDSMTELQFGWKIIAPLLHNIHCGHTSFSMSKSWDRYVKNRRIPSFPLFLKVWKDTMVVVANVNKKDSVFKKGMLVTGINGVNNAELIGNIFSYLPQDGYASNVNYIRLSVNFPYYYRNVYGIYKNYRVSYIDSSGAEKNTTLHFYPSPADSLSTLQRVGKPVKPKRVTRAQRVKNIRSFNIDSSGTFAVLKLNSFSKGHLRNFYRRSFRTLNQSGIKDLVIDIRANGGGEIGNAVALSRYIRSSPFKVADTAVAVSRTLAPYGSHITQHFFNNLGLLFFTHKKRDGQYHFGYWERHVFHPNHNLFSGNVYVLINGYTFSASTLFCNAVKGQQNVRLMGEEAGGGWYGNSGIFIPDIVLPNTKLRVRLPLFRIVQYKHDPANKGLGVPPDIYIGPTIEAAKKDLDLKMEAVKSMISKQQHLQ